MAMKIKIRILFILGLIVLLLPQIGLKHAYEEYMQYVIGLGICIVTFLVHTQLVAHLRKSPGGDSATHDSYKESQPFK